jgi:glycosyltransferase involved in cell wall biosynthesis
MPINNPLVTIGLPVFNGESFLPSALESLLGQSYKNIEIIVSDNNSTDSTKKIILAYRRKDKRIKYYAQKSNIGALKNFEFVLTKAKGKYFCWAAVDDNWNNDFIHYLVKPFIKHDDVVISTCNYELYSGKGNIKYNLSLHNRNTPYESILFFLDHPNYISIFMYSLLKTDCIRSNGIHIDHRPIFEGSSDTMTIYKILLSGITAHTPKILFSKQDTGNYLDAYDILKNKNISNEFVKKVKRFLLFPFMFTFDAYYSIKYTTETNLKLIFKISIYLNIIYKMILQFCQYVWMIIKGAFIYFVNFVS